MKGRGRGAAQCGIFCLFCIFCISTAIHSGVIAAVNLSINQLTVHYPCTDRTCKEAGGGGDYIVGREEEEGGPSFLRPREGAYGLGFVTVRNRKKKLGWNLSRGKQMISLLCIASSEPCHRVFFTAVCPGTSLDRQTRGDVTSHRTYLSPHLCSSSVKSWPPPAPQGTLLSQLSVNCRSCRT